jgi:lipase
MAPQEPARWRQTVSDLRLLFRTVAPDLIGYGKSTPWPRGAPFDLDAELHALQPWLPCCGGKLHVVGYSYGGVVGLHLALSRPTQVRTLTLIEPVFFAALRYAGETGPYNRLCEVRDAFVVRSARGHAEIAMRQFIEFWAGDGGWDKLSPSIRADMLTMADKIVLDWHAVFATDPGREHLATLGPRTALLRGDQSPEAMRRLVDALHGLMPGSSCTFIANANHLLPLTHASAVTGVILSHLHADAERRLR